jgi:hypothetical protein
MSKRNGNKSRFAREQQKKLLRRKRTLEARKEMESKSMEPAIPNPGEAETKTSHAD